MVGKYFKLTDNLLFTSPHVRIKNMEKVEHILNELINGGIHKLQVVTDFDYTITKQHLSNGEKVLTSFGMFDNCKSLPESYKKESLRLVEKYRPIEIDPHMSISEKIDHMIEWWSQSSDLLRGFPLPLEEIDEIAVHFKDALRDGSDDLFKTLNEYNVPCLVFSAGLGDAVTSVLKHAKVMYPNVKVISNFLQYKDGLVDGFKDKIIHVFNKNETALEGTEYYDLIHDRDHVIVMGDSLGDAKMADGIPSSSYVLKIGFLFHHAEHSLPAYLDAFDIVLIDDQTMDVPRAILSLIDIK